MPPVLQRFTINVGGSKPREAMLEGRRHLVAPARILKEAVLDGSQGPGFYPHDENSRNALAWNHQPMVVDHPAVNGVAISARTEAVLNSRKVGLVLNSVINETEKAVDVECWFDIDKTNAVDKRIIPRVLAGEKVECSTGLFANQDPVKGKFGDASYDWIARDHKPDHLAILPDKVGALSVQMGGGLFANAARLPESHLVVADRTAVAALAAVGMEFVANELSFNTTTRLLSDVLSNTHGEKGKYWDGWVTDVFPGYVIYNDGKGKSYQQSYAATDKGVTLSGKPVEVIRTVSYQPVGNAAGPPAKEQKMDRTAKINALVGNGYTEADRVWLDKLPDDALAAVKPVSNAAPPVVPPPAPAPTLTPEQTAALTAALGPDFLAVHNFGRTALTARKTMLTNAIKASGRNPYQDAYLNDRTPEELTALCKLAGVQFDQGGNPVQSQGGSAAPLGNASPYLPGYGGNLNYVPPAGYGAPYLFNAGSPTPGAPAENDEEPLDFPVVNGRQVKKTA